MCPTIGSQAEAYVRSVFRNIQGWDQFVWLDVASNPARPAYFVGEVVVVDDEGEDREIVFSGWFSDRHRERDTEPQKSWRSNARLSRYEVQCLLADLVGRPHPPARGL